MAQQDVPHHLAGDHPSGYHAYYELAAAGCCRRLVQCTCRVVCLCKLCCQTTDNYLHAPCLLVPRVDCVAAGALLFMAAT
jgi:hypothetical protein